MRRVLRFLCSDEAATTVEYAVVLAFIAGACIASVLVLSNAAGNSFDNSATELTSAMGS
ncbi:MAG: Flp family type IVb pilin [Planctomycetota bacterium]